MITYYLVGLNELMKVRQRQMITREYAVQMYLMADEAIMCIHLYAWKGGNLDKFVPWTDIQRTLGARQVSFSFLR